MRCSSLREFLHHYETFAILCLFELTLVAQEEPAVDPKVALARELIKIMDVEKTFEGSTATLFASRG